MEKLSFPATPRKEDGHACFVCERSSREAVRERDASGSLRYHTAANRWQALPACKAMPKCMVVSDGRQWQCSKCLGR